MNFSCLNGYTLYVIVALIGIFLITTKKFFMCVLAIQIFLKSVEIFSVEIAFVLLFCKYYFYNLTLFSNVCFVNIFFHEKACFFSLNNVVFSFMPIYFETSI